MTFSRKLFLHNELNKLDLIHNDVRDRKNLETQGEKINIFLFLLIIILAMHIFAYRKEEDEVFSKFLIFKAKFDNQIGLKIKAVKSNRGSVYLLIEFT